MFQGAVETDIPAGKGSHGGDSYMLEQLFDPEAPPDPWGRAASHLDGAAAVLLGAAANRSMATGQVVTIDALAAGLPPGDPKARQGSSSSA
jgi:hypothetical protein